MCIRNALTVTVLLSVLTPALAISAATSPRLLLAGGGKAEQPVVISATASDAVKVAAKELADMLTRISGATFTVVTGDGTNGLAVGLASDFPAIKTGVAFDAMDPARRDEYLLRTHAGGAYLLGASPVAVRNAVWDWLGRLGYRLYFLTDTWEVVPHIPDLALAVDDVERPSYLTRQAPRGAPWSDKKLWDRWQARNRINSAFNLNTGHAYDHIISENKAAFDAHPEYLGLVNGKRGGKKFCISNPGLRALVVDYAVRTMKAHPAQESISMEPSDGGGWCTCEACKSMGSVSDRVVTLANEVAEAINALGLGKKYVGFYAYNEQSPPPTIDVHPQVIVNLATSFIRGGYTIDTMIAGWKARKATLGIRDYHDVFTWSHDMPRRARGGDIAYLQRTIPAFYAGGARFMNSENSDSWGANGLGYWLSAQFLWDTGNVARADALIDDFLLNAFGAAREPMRGFFALVNHDRSLRTPEDVVARMYRFLADARRLTQDAAVQARLDDLALYTRYVELYDTYRAASGTERQAAFEQIWRHAYRIRNRYMLSTVAICLRERYRDKAVVVPDEAAWNIPEGKNPWKSSAPFSAQEIGSLIDAGVAANRVNEPGFEAVRFSEDLVPAARLGITTPTAGEFSLTGRGIRVYSLWLEKPGSIVLRVTGGLIAKYRDRGNVKLSLLSPLNVTPDPVAYDDSVPPDGEPHTVTLTSPFAGLHTLKVSDGSDMTAIELPAGLPLTVRSDLDKRPPALGSPWSLCFYVPKGTKVIGGYTDSKTGRMLDGAGQPVLDFGRLESIGYFRVPVPAGKDGALWRFERCSGQRLLMTVPPYLARTADELLLPSDVVARDAPTAKQGN